MGVSIFSLFSSKTWNLLVVLFCVVNKLSLTMIWGSTPHYTILHSTLHYTISGPYIKQDLLSKLQWTKWTICFAVVIYYLHTPILRQPEPTFNLILAPIPSYFLAKGRVAGQQHLITFKNPRRCMYIQLRKNTQHTVGEGWTSFWRATVAKSNYSLL